jgi:eukaryotic-like serine/threonine-protein kinase
LLEGETLAQRLQRGPVPLEETLTIARQVGSALQAAHRAGVVHRDLKPDNVFLCAPREELPGPNVKVLDFGISKIRGSQTVATQDAVLMGTPQYMAPEQALGKNTAIDARTDVFALGAIVYEMLGGLPAFGGSSLAEVVYKVVHAQPQPLAQLCARLPLNVLSAVDRALQKDAAHRPAEVSAFISELTGRPLTVPVTTPRTAGLDATLASPARALAVPSAVTDATYTPATPVPASTEPFRPATPVHPWATPLPAAQVPALPAVAPIPLATPVQARWGPTPAAAPPRALVPPARKPARSAFRVVLGVLVVLAFLGIFRRHVRVGEGDGGAQLKKLQAALKTGAADPDVSKLPPEAVAGLQKGLEEAKRGIRQALGEVEAQREDAKRAAEEARVRAEVGQQEARAAQRHTGTGAGAAAGGEPPAVKELLADAEEALDDGDAQLALRLADQSFFSQKTSAGWAVKARAFCLLKDLGNARAALANVTARSDRKRVLADCKESGVDLR